MPIYEFVCNSCSKEFEELVPYGTEKAPCPACGGTDVRKLVSMVAFSAGGKMTTTASSSGCASCTSSSCSSCGR